MSAGAPCASPRTARYRRRESERTVLYRTVRTHLATWLELACDSQQGNAVAAQVKREFRRYLICGIVADGTNAAMIVTTRKTAPRRRIQS